MRPAPRIHPDLFCAPPDHPARREGPSVVWPQSVADAFAAVRGRKPKDYPGRFVVLACAIGAAAESDEDLLTAYRILVEVSNLSGRRRATMRAIAAVNMVPILASLGHEGALVVAAIELREAYPFADEVEGLSELFLSAQASVEYALKRLRARGMLRWTSDSELNAADDVARERVGLLPDHPFDGAWRAVREILRRWGLDVEGHCQVKDPVRVLPKTESLHVERWRASAAA